MTEQEIIEKLTPIFHDIFDSSVVVTASLDATQVAEWDSLNHISLIVAIEGVFDCELTTEDVAQMLTVGDLFQILQEKDSPE